MPHLFRSTVGVAVSLLLLASRTDAQKRCRLLCAPSLKVEPTVTLSNLFSRPRIQTLPEGTVETATREAEFELVLAVDIPTRAPRLAFTVEASSTPFADNPVEAGARGQSGMASHRSDWGLGQLTCRCRG